MIFGEVRLSVVKGIRCQRSTHENPGTISRRQLHLAVRSENGCGTLRLCDNRLRAQENDARADDGNRNERCCQVLFFFAFRSLLLGPRPRRRSAWMSSLLLLTSTLEPENLE